MQSLIRNKIKIVDLFCGAGGLTHGLQRVGLPVVVGIDLEDRFRFAYEKNNQGTFVCEDIRNISAKDLKSFFGDAETSILVGCAPCQTFSRHTLKNKKRQSDQKWTLINEFLRLIKRSSPDIVSMENVPEIAKTDIFKGFIEKLKSLDYHLDYNVIFCPDYGIPQNRKRLVLLASKKAPIALIDKSHDSDNYITVENTIGDLPKIKAGEVSSQDFLHQAAGLSEINLKRIRVSKPGGFWRDWPEELILNCHKKASGKSYGSVYSRMEWGKQSPTITTQFYNFGTGRFGHPEQDRALSIREGALLQTFPRNYEFVESPEDMSITNLGIMIGNAVPVRLGEVVGESIKKHLDIYNYET